MTRFPIVSLLAVTAAAFGANGLVAEEKGPLAEETNPAEKPLPTPAKSRLISAETAELLAAAAPKYAPSPATNTAREPETDLRETDKPRNGIIRLPDYIVQEKKLPKLNDRELLTPQGRLELALKRHPGLRFGSFGRNGLWANALLEEESGIERQAEMAELMSLLPGTGPAKKPILTGRPPFSLGGPWSGPWGGLVVPWERR